MTRYMLSVHSVASDTQEPMPAENKKVSRSRYDCFIFQVGDLARDESVGP